MRTRLSLEMSAEDKAEIVAHGAELGTRKLVKTIRAAIRRSHAAWVAEQRGTLLVETDSEVEELKL